MGRRFFLTIIAVLAGSLVLGGPWFTPAKSLTYAGAFPKPGKDDRCPVCGMFVYKYPKWAAGFIFDSGARYFHCCPKCMLHNLLNVSKYQPGEARANIRLIWVTEYYTTKQLDAHDVFFLVGTNLIGPMGLDLIPVQGKMAAENLNRDYNGELILTLDQITMDIIDKARKGKFK